MEICVAIGTGILGKIFEYTVAPVGRQVGYLFCYTSNVDKLRTQVQKLKDAKETLRRRINEVRRNGEVIETRVENWMIEAAGMLEKAEIFLNDEGHIKARLSCGSSPGLVSRHQLSRRAKKMTAQIATDVESSEKFSTISYRPEIESGIGLFKGYQDFETRNEALKRVMEVLRDPTVRMVALYGMGGVGKTMLAKEVMRLSKEEQLFSEMVITSVSQTVNLKNIQQEIADHLDFKFDVESTERRADKLRNRLKEEKNFLLVLDDIWKEIDLHKIGIHFENDQKGCNCKILLTSRSQDVVCNRMDIKNSIGLDCLSNDEAEGLFSKIVGSTVEQPNFRDLVKECAGLPIAIVTLASALKNKSDEIWENALKQLQSSKPENIEGMHEDVYKCIKFSYDYLPSEEAKSLLLLCSLHKEDENIQINYLVRYCAGWGILDGIVTLKDTRNRVKALVDTLKSRCLLLDGYGHETVKMHDIIRDVSIWIAAKERNIYSLSDISKLEDLLNKEKLKDSKAISMLDIDFGKLLQKMEFKHLELLLVHCNDQLEWTIPEHFFEETKELKVFILNGSSEITLQLSSFHFPNNLRSLCLRSSELQDVGLIGDLKNLNIIDLSDSDIYQLPKEFGQLIQLKLLDLRGCDNLEVIEPNVLSSLVRLEELYVAEEFDKWEVEGVNTKRRNASLIELKNLRELTTLYLCVGDIQMFPNESLFGDKLRRYQIHIQEKKYYKDYSSSLVFEGCERSRITSFGFQTLMRSLERMSLIRLSEVKNNVFYDVDLGEFPTLKKLKLSDCDEVQYVVNALEEKNTIHACSPIFIKLEILHLESLKNLVEIIHGTMTAGSFSQLRKVNVKNCGKLKTLFPLSIATILSRIRVEECEMMEGIVGCDQREDEVIVFDKLRHLSLHFLPKLVEFMISRPQLGATTASSSAKSFNYPLFGEKVKLSSSIL